LSIGFVAGSGVVGKLRPLVDFLSVGFREDEESLILNIIAGDDAGVA
jgi:hypothetical protein